MEKELMEAAGGRLLWLRLSRKYKVDRYILLPHEESEYNGYAVDYLEAYLKKEGAQSALFVTSDRQVLDRVSAYSGSYDVRGIYLPQGQMQSMMRFYALYPFSDQAVIVSLTIPYDTCGENLLGIPGVTRRELFCYDIYRFDCVPQLEEGIP